MPRYEYKCKKCGRSFEVTHGISESVDSCEFCGGEVRRVFHPVGIVFKGSGFYSTDSRGSATSTSKPAPAAEEKVSQADGASSSDDKKDRAHESKGSKSA